MHPAQEPFQVREIWPQGTVINRDYVIQRRLGSGGFGTVYLARHRFLDTMNVIKRLHDQYASDVEFARKFMNEGRAIRRLRTCPHIVEVEHMTQTDDGHLILVMEYIPGGDLNGLMESRVLSVEEAIEYGRQIAVGLQAAHKAGLIHRDIKPQNVLVSEDESGSILLKLIDFGIAADHARPCGDKRDAGRVDRVCGSGAVGAGGKELGWPRGSVCVGRDDIPDADAPDAVPGLVRFGRLD